MLDPADQDVIIADLEDRERLRANGAGLIATERQRQIDKEGYSLVHDAAHDRSELLLAAYCYLGDLINEPHRSNPNLWPWAYEDWKPTPGDRERQLVKAGALIAAEIDRLHFAEVLRAALEGRDG